MPTSVVLSPVDRAIDELIAALHRRDFVVVGPRQRNGAIVLDEVRRAADLPVGWTDVQERATYRVQRTEAQTFFDFAVGPQSPRRYLVPPRKSLWSAVRVGDGFEIGHADAPSTRYAFLGVRACELAAIAVQDSVLRNGMYRDPDYAAVRDRAFFVGVNCGHSVATCFCTSMDTGPRVTAGHDLGITELIGDGGHRLVVEAATESGSQILAEVAAAVECRPVSTADADAVDATLAQATRQQHRRIDPLAARDVLIANLEHPRWNDVASRCLSCTNCTLVCPTCFCSAVEDVGALDGDRAERVQRWDSCFTLGHSELHGAGSVRGDTRARYRQWLTHKLSTWWDQFGESGCVGCGRCIAWCPAGIDITEEVAAIAEGATT